jgi:hypothetical protein
VPLLQSSGTRPSIIVATGQNDLVDEPADARVADREPRSFNPSEVTLQALDQAHEVPNREHVVLHEAPDASERGQLLIEGVALQRLAIRSGVVQEQPE